MTGIYYYRVLVCGLKDFDAERPSERTDGLFYAKCSGFVYTENEEPQPQVVSALGLRMTNCEPCRLSV